MSNIDVGKTSDSTKLLRGYVDRIETLVDEKKTVSDDIKSVYDEAVGEGFDKKALRTLIRKRQQDRAELENLEAIVDTYETALNSNT